MVRAKGWEEGVDRGWQGNALALPQAKLARELLKKDTNILFVAGVHVGHLMERDGEINNAFVWHSLMPLFA